jgi:hypothetical protein
MLSDLFLITCLPPNVKIKSLKRQNHYEIIKPIVLVCCISAELDKRYPSFV